MGQSHYASVVRLAVRQANAVGAHQLRDLGISRHWVLDNTRAGFMTPATHGVYVVGCDPGALPRETTAMVGVLRCAGSGALSFESAAEWHGVWDRGDADLHVSTTRHSSGRLCGLSSGIVLHTHRVRELRATDVVSIRGYPVTSIRRTITDLGRVLDPYQLAHVIWNALYAEMVSVPVVQRCVDRATRAPGIAAVRRALDLIDGNSCGTKSRSEDEFLDIVRRQRYPMPLVNVLDAVGMPGVRLDFVWPDLRVVVELDGRHHTMPGIRASDRSVTRALRAAGWTVVRLHYSTVWSDPMRVVEVLDRALTVR